MCTPGLVVADAGQAYEALESNAITESVDALFHEAPKFFKAGTVSVLKAKKSVVEMGGTM